MQRHVNGTVSRVYVSFPPVAPARHVSRLALQSRARSIWCVILGSCPLALVQKIGCLMRPGIRFLFYLTSYAFPCCFTCACPSWKYTYVPQACDVHGGARLQFFRLQTRILQLPHMRARRARRHPLDSMPGAEHGDSRWDPIIVFQKKKKQGGRPFLLYLRIEPRRSVMFAYLIVLTLHHQRETEDISYMKHGDVCPQSFCLFQEDIRMLCIYSTFYPKVHVAFDVLNEMHDRSPYELHISLRVMCRESRGPTWGLRKDTFYPSSDAWVHKGVFRADI